MAREIGITALLIGLLMIPSGALPADRDYARSMVITRQGIVATSQTLASQAGAQVLARGGSAVDAAIAANAVLSVIEPMSCGIGGDLFVLYRDGKTGKLTGLNASGWAPKGLTIQMLKSKGIAAMPKTGVYTITVPGCVDGWEKLHKRFGKLPWSELFLPAIHYATHGFPVTEMIQRAWYGEIMKLTEDRYTRHMFLPGGAAPKLGEIFQNPDLAKALGLFAKGGAAEFYRGSIAKALLRTSDLNGGVLSATDLSEYQAEWVDPISTEYRGWKVYELPPNGQGIAALEMLNILAAFDMSKYEPSSAGALHLKIEAQKLAYQDLQRYIGDPRFTKIPLDGLLSMPYAAERAGKINPEKANCDVTPGNPPPTAGDTIYLSAVDRDGNVVSLIQSIYSAFGSGLAVYDMGFHLHNRGALFTLDPAHPNALAPRKRPFHTIIPAYMEKANLHIGFGIMGGLNQAQAHAQFVSNIADYGMNIQAALEAPRFTRREFEGCEVTIEGRIPAPAQRQLEEQGHILDTRAAYDDVVGGGQAVLHDSSAKVNFGASSPRKDGAAVPEPDPYFQK
ncbi:MAG: gamma-glutamyltransferase [Bryobacteraceae bacterium]